MTDKRNPYPTPDPEPEEEQPKAASPGAIVQHPYDRLLKATGHKLVKGDSGDKPASPINPKADEEADSTDTTAIPAASAGDVPGAVAPGGVVMVPSGSVPPGMVPVVMVPVNQVPGAQVPGAGIPVAGVPGAAVPGAGVPGAGVPGAAVPGAGVPGAAVPGAVPGAQAGAAGAPGAQVPGAGVPGAQVPGAGVPGAQVPGAGVPGAGVPVGAVPVSGTPSGQLVPVIQVPAQAPPPGGMSKRTLTALLVGGSASGIAAIMAGLLMVLSPTGPIEEPPDEVNIQAAGNSYVIPPTVGPGGPGVPLTAADPTAPPPQPATQPVAPLTLSPQVVAQANGAGLNVEVPKPAEKASPEPKVTAPKTSKPLKISIPAVGVNRAKIGTVGVTKKGEIATPSMARPKETAWYKFGPAPGDQGPAVILGHVNTRSGAAVFSRLRDIKRGNKISILRADGKLAVFTVDGVEQVSKKAFPTKRVYGNTITSSLRLITCGGAYNAKTHHYTDNIVVYATLTEVRG
ncbi:class F sortase [Herbidospora daliensis]|uniref:class F sortase n=1 Tax=Herbidospora daliensis TaxID=295585 RepID=UPI000A4A304E|nr:class F sortase [Herbidospora daliensis]